jgi:hypothetical protein
MPASSSGGSVCSHERGFGYRILAVEQVTFGAQEMSLPNSDKITITRLEETS